MSGCITAQKKIVQTTCRNETQLFKLFAIESHIIALKDERQTIKHTHSQKGAYLSNLGL
jgi:hypothetical protein